MGHDVGRIENDEIVRLAVGIDGIDGDLVLLAALVSVTAFRFMVAGSSRKMISVSKPRFLSACFICRSAAKTFFSPSGPYLLRSAVLLVTTSFCDFFGMT